MCINYIYSKIVFLICASPVYFLHHLQHQRNSVGLSNELALQPS